jgi:hypothetical protein
METCGRTLKTQPLEVSSRTAPARSGGVGVRGQFDADGSFDA